MLLNAKCKKCRRIGEKLFLKGERCFTPKCAMVRNPNPPGVHGKSSRRTASEFGIQLREKQKAKYIYKINERQLNKYFQKAAKRKSGIEDFLLRFLEQRLDNVVHKLGFALSHSIARQGISHGHFLVNGRKVTIPSYQLKVGDEVSINPKLLNSNLYKDLKISLKKYETPSWLSLDKEKLIGKVVTLPKKEDIKTSLNMKKIVEYFSH